MEEHLEYARSQGFKVEGDFSGIQNPPSLEDFKNQLEAASRPFKGDDAMKGTVVAQSKDGRHGYVIRFKYEG